MTRNAARVLLGLTVLTALVLAASPAMADAVNYTINLGNYTTPSSGVCGIGSQAPGYCPGGTVAPPYATVTLTLSNDKTSIGVDVKMEGDYVLWGQGNGNMFAFNYAGGSNRLQISSDLGAKLGTGVNMAAFGGFQYVVNSKTVSDQLRFTITRTDGGLFNSATDLAAPNSKDYLFAMHMATSADGGGISGYAGAGTAPLPTPEPASLALLGSGLVALGGFARRFRKH